MTAVGGNCGLAAFALKFAEVSEVVKRSSEKLGLCFRRLFCVFGIRGRSPRYGYHTITMIHLTKYSVLSNNKVMLIGSCLDRDID